MSLRRRLALYLAVLATCMAALLTFTLYLNLRQQLRDDLKVRLYNAAILATLQIDAEANAAIFRPEDANTPGFRRIKAILERIRNHAVDVGALYTLSVTNDGNLVVAVDPGLAPNLSMPPGTPYPPLPASVAKKLHSQDGPLTGDGFKRDDDGIWLEGYAPLLGPDGRLRGVLYMDMSAHSVVWREWRFLRVGLPILGVFILLGWVLGLLLGKGLAEPIESLKEGALAIANGDLTHRVPVTTGDEIGELAEAFNSMTSLLSVSRTSLEQEIAERRQAEEALAESEKKYRTLYSDAYVGLYKSRFPDGRLIACNNRFSQMLGFLSAQDAADVSLGGERYADPLRREDLTAELGKKGYVDSFEALFLREDKSTFWIRFSARLVDGGTAVEGMAVDFTREKTAIDRLKDAEKKYRGIFENALEGIFQCGMDGPFLSVNPSMAAILGYGSPEDLLDKVANTSALFAEENEKKEFFSLLSRTGVTPGMAVRFKRADGEQRWGWIQARTVEDETGGRFRVEGMLQDVTERREAETLQKARIEAEASNRAKSEFLAAMSHEMRTPMTAIVGMTELMNETVLNEEQEHYVQTLKTAADTLLALIGDIQDLAKIESGRLNLELIPFNLLEAVEKTCETMAVAAHEENLDLACRVAPETPAHLVGDSLRVRQILATLIQNAIEYTTEGTVVVEVGPGMGEPDGDLARIEFSVTGACQSIDPESLTSLFDTYAPAAIAASSHHRSSRLGLRVARELVRLMDGGMHVESRPEEGTSFHFSAAFPVRKKGEAEAGTPAVFKNLSVLVADPQEASRRFIREALNAAGSRVTEASDASGALAILKDSWMMPKGYDLVVLAQDLPGADVFELAEQVKVDHLTPECVILFGENYNQSDVARARAMGCERYVARPLDLSRFYRALAAAARSAKGEKEEAEPGKLPPLDILLAEDSETNRFVVRAYLKNTPCQVHIAENGRKAVEKFRSRRFDVVIMDNQMPVMDGNRATAEIRRYEKDKGLSRTPIIAMTAYASQADEEEFSRLGYDALLAKPVKKNALFAAILRQVIGRKEARATASREEDFLFEKDEPILAWVNPELMEIAPHYLESVSKNAEEILEALDNGSFDTVGTLAAQMKTESRAFGLDTLSDLGSSIREFAEAHEADQVRRLVTRLSNYLARVEIV
ncbi:MAG: response regulator [Pseudomonadota bacterium]